MPKSEDSQERQIAKLKEMLAHNETIAEQMRTLIAELECKTRDSKDRNRNN